ncbi:hypothetical protein C0991_003605, partial [Blastosporella zonata]
MGLGLPNGGHLTHGYYTTKKKMTASSIYFQSFSYSIIPETGQATAEKEGAYLMADIAHASGLIAAQELNNPFEYCDVVTTTTHKTDPSPSRKYMSVYRDRMLSYVPLNDLGLNQARFVMCNSSLSEYGTLGFKLGYSLVSPDSLTMWEAQTEDAISPRRNCNTSILDLTHGVTSIT